MKSDSVNAVIVADSDEEDIIITNQDNMDGFATKADANEYAKEYAYQF